MLRVGLCVVQTCAVPAVGVARHAVPQVASSPSALRFLQMLPAMLAVNAVLTQHDCIWLEKRILT